MGGGMGSSMMGMAASGLAFGAGSEIAHQGVRAMMGGGGLSVDWLRTGRW